MPIGVFGFNGRAEEQMSFNANYNLCVPTKQHLPISRCLQGEIEELFTAISCGVLLILEVYAQDSRDYCSSFAASLAAMSWLSFKFNNRAHLRTR